MMELDETGNDKLNELFGEEEQEGSNNEAVELSNTMVEEDGFGIFEESEGEQSEGLESNSEQEPPASSPKVQKRKKTLSDVRIQTIKLETLKSPKDINYTPRLLKLPGFMGIQKNPFSVNELLEQELAEVDDKTATEGSNAASILLRAATTIRHLVDPSTGEVKSNAHLVKWSDNSWSIMVGEEMFEVSMQSMTAENNYIFGKHIEAASMECLGKLGERVMVRPYVTADQGHRKYLAAAAVASNKASADVRVKMAVTVADPEREKQRMIKLEQEKIKARRKLEAKKRNLKQRSFERVSRTGLTAKFLEEGDIDEFSGEAIVEEPADEYDDDFIDDTNIDGDEDEDDDKDEDEDDDDETEKVEETEEGETEGETEEEEIKREKREKKESSAAINISKSETKRSLESKDEKITSIKENKAESRPKRVRHTPIVSDDED